MTPSFVEDKCDYHELKNNSDKLKGLYFYAEPVYLDYEKAHNTFDPKKMLDDDDDDKDNK